MRRGARIAVRVFLIVGVGLQIGAGVAAVNTIRWLNSTVTTTGKVIALDGRRSSKGGRTYAEHVQFTTDNGSTFEFKSSVSTSSPFQVGETVPVRYDPLLPSRADVDTPFRRWFVAGLLGLMGVVWTAMGLFAFGRRVTR